MGIRTMKQIFYHSENIHLNYFGAYASTQVINSSLCITNILTDQQVILVGEEFKINHLCQLLIEGVTDEELTNLLQEIGQSELYDILLQKGLIE